MLKPIDLEVQRLVETVLAARPDGRIGTILREILEFGSVTTEKLQQLGLSEPRRAPMDAKDYGIPIVSIRVKRADGRYIAAYSFGTAADILIGRKGRGAVPKKFRNELLEHYDHTDSITGAKLSSRVLTIDHRIPYQVNGDSGLAERDKSAFMLLDKQSQRLKSWSCENCPNFTEIKNPRICSTCFWAFPESYSHIATEDIRRTELIWQGNDVLVHDGLQEKARSEGVTVVELLKRLARQA